MPKPVAEVGEGHEDASGNGVYCFIRDLIVKGGDARFVDNKGRYAINWSRALKCYHDYKSKRNPQYNSKNITRRKASNGLRAALLNSYKKEGAKEYKDCKKVNENDEVVERQFQMPHRVFESLFGSDVQLSNDSSEYEPCSTISEVNTSGISESDHDATQEDSLEQWLKDVNLQIRINPTESPLEGGAPCLFSFNPTLHSEVRSGYATFENLATVPLERLSNGSLHGIIPASPQPGLVSVTLTSQHGKNLGQTNIKYYGQQEVVKKIVRSPFLVKKLCEEYSMVYGFGETGETDIEALNSRILGITDPMQLFRLLVYTAAEVGAQQFIEMIFNSSAGRIVFEAYKGSSQLPEVIARDHGNEETAQYLECITKRFCDEIRSGKECFQTIDWSELAKAAEAAQKKLDLTNEKEDNLEKLNDPEETGYLGDADSFSEASAPQSSDSEDDISARTKPKATATTKIKRKGSVSSQERKIGQKDMHREDRKRDTENPAADSQDLSFSVQNDMRAYGQPYHCRNYGKVSTSGPSTPSPGLTSSYLPIHARLPTILSTTEYPGNWNFQMYFGPLTESASKSATWTYSDVCKKLYVNLTSFCPIKFKTSSPPPPGTYLRAVAIFKGSTNLHDIVKRCPDHMESSNDGSALNNHFIESNNPAARYYTCPESSRHSVLLPYNGPQGTEYVTEMFAFKCFSSCAAGPSRRPVQVIFTLVRDGQTLGRRVVEVRVCACPGRDRTSEENVACEKPSSSQEVRCSTKGSGNKGPASKRREASSRSQDEEVVFTCSNYSEVSTSGLSTPPPGLTLSYLPIHARLPTIPSTTEYPGNWNFQVSFGPLTESASKFATWTYSDVCKKLYVNLASFCPIKFKTSSPPPPGTYLRAVAVFKGSTNLHDIVKRCPNHMESSNDVTDSLCSALNNHFIQSNNPAARYHTCPESLRHSVLLPYNGPQVGTEYVTEMFAFKCFSSCAAGPSRRPVQVIFTLERDGQTLGRRVVEVRVCACPGRDRTMDEKVACGEPSLCQGVRCTRKESGNNGPTSKRRRTSSRSQDEEVVFTCGNYSEVSTSGLSTPPPGLTLSYLPIHADLPTIPSTTEYPGNWNFQVSFGPLTESASKFATWTYSDVCKKLYVNLASFCPINFKTSSPPPPGTYLRAVAVFKGSTNLHDIVKRCPNHIESSNDGSALNNHFIQSNNPAARYHTCPESLRHSVLLPYNGPQVGTEYVTEMFAFKCFSSCAAGPSRRPVQVIFTLERDGQTLGRRVVEVRVCACAGRDRTMDEKVACGEPSLCQGVRCSRKESGNNGPTSKRRRTSSRSQDEEVVFTTKNRHMYNFLVEMRDSLDSELESFNTQSPDHSLVLSTSEDEADHPSTSWESRSSFQESGTILDVNPPKILATIEDPLGARQSS